MKIDHLQPLTLDVSAAAWPVEPDRIESRVPFNSTAPRNPQPCNSVLHVCKQASVTKELKRSKNTVSLVI